MTELNTFVHEQADRLLRFYPQLNIFNPESLDNLIRDEIFSLLQPTLSILNSVHKNYGNNTTINFNSRKHLEAAVDRRIEMIGKFLSASIEAVGIYRTSTSRSEGQGYKSNPNLPICFRSLAGDSHNGGTRPLAIEVPNGTVVLKFSDPRPYQITSKILGMLSKGIGMDLTPPPIFPSKDNQWYFIKYIDDTSSIDGNVTSFMHAIGAITAVAYCLSFVDLHLENIIVEKSKPIIIDPECIFYNFDRIDTPSERLLSTGLLSHDPILSSLRGGNSAGDPLFDFDLFLEEDGFLGYRKPANNFRNRIRKHGGGFADPSDYKSEVISGYLAAYTWFASNTDKVCDIIDNEVPDDFRVRFLARKTRHYASVIHMLNLPQVDNYPEWREEVFNRFKASGHFPETASTKMLSAELLDLENRDIPFFWVNASDKFIQHRTGSIQPLKMNLSIKDQAIRDIKMLRRQSAASHINILNEFLDFDLTQPLGAMINAKPLFSPTRLAEMKQ